MYDSREHAVTAIAGDSRGYPCPTQKSPANAATAPPIRGAKMYTQTSLPDEPLQRGEILDG
jgi:hypothetical protein